MPAEGLRILLLSNMFPTSRGPSNGTFITRRIEAQRRLGNGVTPFAVRVRPRGMSSLSALRVLNASGPVLPGSGFVDPEVRVSLAQYLAVRRGRAPLRVTRGFALELTRCLRGRVDVIHAHGMYGLPAGAVARELSQLLNVPFVVTLHGGDVNVFMEWHAATYSEILSDADKVIYVSNALRRRAAELGAPQHGAFVVPNGVDTDTFHPDFGAMQDRCSGNRRPRILFVGHLTRVKGADRLPAIIRLVASEFRGAELLVIGQGELAHSIRRESKGLRVVLLGELPHEQVAREMRQADVLVLPSRSEGWPTVVMEAHASGTPVVGADVGGVAEAIGDPRFVVPDDDRLEARFAGIVLDILSGRLRASGLIDRASAHSWLNLARQEDLILREAVENG